MKKKLLSLVLTICLAAATLTGCASKSDDTTIKVAASTTPHAEILEAAKPLLKEQGWNLEITEFQDYVQPNLVVESGDFDANYFQHVQYLNNFNAENGTDLVIAGAIHYEPFGIYPGTETDLAYLTDGAVIAVPNDTTNEARALLLLQEKEIIKLAEDAGLEATVKDIVENPYNVEIKELEAAQIPRVLDEVSFAILNGNYAMEAGLNVALDAVAYESAESAVIRETYANVIAVKNGNENSEKIQALVDTLASEEIKKFVDEKYQGSVILIE